MNHPPSLTRWPGLLIAAAVILLGSATLYTGLHAQTFQYHYGNPQCRDAGRSVVRAISPDGGYLTVGESFSGAGCDNADLYVVRFNADGSRRWSQIYNLQGLDSATDVVACVNGDFVITGSTTGSTGSRDLFLLRISPLGAILNTYVFGWSNTDDYGWDVIETTFGNGGFTLPGDIVVVGWRGSVGARDPFIMRTRANLTFVWDAAYLGFWDDDTNRNRDDYFLAVEESRLPFGAGGGDLIAVGGTNSVGFGNTDVLLTRFDHTGIPIANRVIGGVNDDEAQSVMEVLTGVNTGDVVIAGSTRSRDIFVGPNLDCYVLQTSSNFGVLRGDLIFGHGLLDDEAFSISPDLFYSPDRSAMIVTGYTNTELGTLARENVFLQRIAGGVGALLGSGKIYGGNGNDRGYDIARPAPFPVAAPPETPGYVVSGFTKSPNLILGDPEQLYLIKTDSFLVSGCNEHDVFFTPVSPNWALETVIPIGVGLSGPQILALTTEAVFWETPICGFRGGNRTERGEEEGVAGLDPQHPQLEAASAFSFPNPLRSGEQLNLRFELPAPSAATIVVTDILGRTVARHEADFAAGSVLTGLPTEGWPAGTYVVRIVAGDMRKECKVMIGE